MQKLSYFTFFEKCLWIFSTILITVSFFIGGGSHELSLLASLIGVTSLLFLAKGNVVGQALTIIFSLLYGYISFELAYYGEMITYLCMTAPAAFAAMIAWIKNPYKENKSEVAVGIITLKKFLRIILLSVAVTVLFYFILKYFNTAYLPLSTLSVTTSFIAVALTYYRSEFYALAYAVNDLVLITLWSFASIQNLSYLTMIICFVLFLVNDIYAYCNWRKMKVRQQNS